MANEGGTWIMYGLDWEDPFRIRTWQELINWINEVGFLPLFKNEIPGFSAEEHVSPLFWWTGDPSQDPWEWRELIAASGQVAYGKFFDKKSGFISREWFPVFANFRRDGYDFDAAWDDELVQIRYKKLMDCFDTREKLAGYQLKPMAGFGKEGYKNFDGCVTALQMQTYLVIREFKQRVNRKGKPYGMPVSYYVKPEALWGYDHVTSAYKEDPKVSGERIFARVKECFPEADMAQIRKFLR